MIYGKYILIIGIYIINNNNNKQRVFIFGIFPKINNNYKNIYLNIFIELN